MNARIGSCSIIRIIMTTCSAPIIFLVIRLPFIISLKDERRETREEGVMSMVYIAI